MPVPFVFGNVTNRPNRLDSIKDEKYHLCFARYCGNSLSNPIMNSYYWRVYRNWQFYGGRQWIGPDSTVFFEDSDGNSRGRERYVQNIIRPFVNQMVGEAMKMSLEFKAISQGDRVINRRDKELLNMKSLSSIADQYPNIRNHIKKKMPIGNSQEETEEIFRNVWVDQYERTVNNLITFIATENDLSTTQRRRVAESISITGLGVFKNEGKSGDLVTRMIQSENFFFDGGAENYNLSDAEFMGDTDFALPTDIYERYDISKETKLQIEKYTRNMPASAQTVMPLPYSYYYQPGRIPKIYCEWRDSDQHNYGYVKDQFGYEFFTRVYPNNYKPKENQRVYFEHDLIETQVDYRKILMKGKKIKPLDMEVLRYCIFTPSEVYTGGEGHDIVYEYGVVPFQETYNLKPSQVDFSYKCVTWNYHDGIIDSPVNDIIDPQRLINRFNSIAEAKANKSGSEGVIIDAWAAMGTNTNEEELQRKAERGETIIVNSRGMGAPQVSGHYGSNMIQGAQAVKMLGQEYEAAAARMTGVFNIPNAKENKKILMGQEAEEQSIHALFLSCVEDITLQQYQCYGNKGRKIYSQSPRRLAIAVGDKGAQEITITKDMLLEDFRIDIKRTDDDKNSKMAADAKLDAWLAAGIITKPSYAESYGRTTLEKLGDVVRDNLVREQVAQKAQAEQQQQQQQIQSMQQQATDERLELERKRQEGIALSEAEKNRLIELEKIIMRGKTSIDTAKVKGELKKEEIKMKDKE